MLAPRLFETGVGEATNRAQGAAQHVAQEIPSMGTSSPTELATEVVASFVSSNPLPTGELPALIHAVHATVARLAAEQNSAPPQIEPKAPAVPIRRSITPEFLICLEDGKRFKSMRRHLAGLGLSPDQYRKKWNLPADYPMVRPTTPPRGRRWRKRSDLAGSIRRAPSGRSRPSTENPTDGNAPIRVVLGLHGEHRFDPN